METIENIKAAIAEIDLKAKVKGIMSKAMRRQRQKLLQQLSTAQLSLIPVIDCNPCSKPVCIDDSKTALTVVFKTPHLDKSYRVSAYEVQYCTGRILLEMELEAKRKKRRLKQKMNEAKNKYKVNAEKLKIIEDQSSYLAKKIKWKTTSSLNFRKTNGNTVLYELQNVPTEEPIIVKVELSTPTRAGDLGVNQAIYYSHMSGISCLENAKNQ